MATVDKNTDTWLNHLRSNPDKLRRHVHRGLLDGDDPELWAKITERVQRGFMGELAVAAYLRAPYEWRLENPADTDVDGVQVRTVSDFKKRLITHEYDPQAPYVLAVADYGTASVVLRGWLHLRHCNVREHWRNDSRAPAYFVPATALHPMATLRQYYQQRKRRCA
jgi:hypothetical protein